MWPDALRPWSFVFSKSFRCVSRTAIIYIVSYSASPFVGRYLLRFRKSFLRFSYLKRDVRCRRFSHRYWSNVLAVCDNTYWYWQYIVFISLDKHRDPNGFGRINIHFQPSLTFYLPFHSFSIGNVSNHPPTHPPWTPSKWLDHCQPFVQSLRVRLKNKEIFYPICFRLHTAID